MWMDSMCFVWCWAIPCPATVVNAIKPNPVHKDNRKRNQILIVNDLILVIRGMKNLKHTKCNHAYVNTIYVYAITCMRV